jgi:hypothetical protein
MLDTAILCSVADRMMSGGVVEMDDKSIPVRRTSSQRLRTLAFAMDWREYQAIEQNPEKSSRWGQVARSGHQVVRFKDAGTNKFVAVSVDGKVTVSGAAPGRALTSLRNRM